MEVFFKINIFYFIKGQYLLDLQAVSVTDHGVYPVR